MIDNRMHPRLLTTPFFTIHTFGVLLAPAYVAAFWWLMREGRRERIDIDLLSSLAFWAIAGQSLVRRPSWSCETSLNSC
jgi:phosphatidylglycerol---prolipoprotein diacylglyceryl transferase